MVKFQTRLKVKFCAPLNPNITLVPGGVTWNNTIISRMIGTGNSSIIETINPSLTEGSLPQYPPLPGSLDRLKRVVAKQEPNGME